MSGKYPPLALAFVKTQSSADPKWTLVEHTGPDRIRILSDNSVVCPIDENNLVSPYPTTTVGTFALGEKVYFSIAGFPPEGLEMHVLYTGTVVKQEVRVVKRGNSSSAPKRHTTLIQPDCLNGDIVPVPTKRVVPVTSMRAKTPRLKVRDSGSDESPIDNADPASGSEGEQSRDESTDDAADDHSMSSREEGSPVEEAAEDEAEMAVAEVPAEDNSDNDAGMVVDEEPAEDKGGDAKAKPQVVAPAIEGSLKTHLRALVAAWDAAHRAYNLVLTFVGPDDRAQDGAVLGLLKLTKLNESDTLDESEDTPRLFHLRHLEHIDALRYIPQRGCVVVFRTDVGCSHLRAPPAPHGRLDLVIQDILHSPLCDGDPSRLQELGVLIPITSVPSATKTWFRDLKSEISVTACSLLGVHKVILDRSVARLALPPGTHRDAAYRAMYALVIGVIKQKPASVVFDPAGTCTVDARGRMLRFTCNDAAWKYDSSMFLPMCAQISSNVARKRPLDDSAAVPPASASTSKAPCVHPPDRSDSDSAGAADVDDTSYPTARALPPLPSPVEAVAAAAVAAAVAGVTPDQAAVLSKAGLERYVRVRFDDGATLAFAYVAGTQPPLRLFSRCVRSVLEMQKQLRDVLATKRQELYVIPKAVPLTEREFAHLKEHERHSQLPELGLLDDKAKFADPVVLITDSGLRVLLQSAAIGSSAQVQARAAKLRGLLP